jgi:hypothetical protein
MLDPVRQEKLQGLARALASQAQQAEKDGNTDDAAKSYVKLVDILLLLARESESDHVLWSKYTKQAEAYQARVKTMISSGRISDAVKSGSSAGATSAPSGNTSHQNNSQGPKESPLKKILKPFQRSEAMDEQQVQLMRPPKQLEEEETEKIHLVGEKMNQTSDSPSSRFIQDRGIAGSNQEQSESQVFQLQTRISAIPYELFEQIREEKNNLQETVAALNKEKEELSSALNAKRRELEQLKSNTVPLSDYQSLQAQVQSNQVARGEIEQLQKQLSSSVPRSQYDQLLNKISEMVPRSIYVEAEVRATKLELELRDMVPRHVLDNLASEVSLISTLSTIPLAKEPDCRPNVEVEELKITKKEDGSSRDDDDGPAAT